MTLDAANATTPSAMRLDFVEGMRAVAALVVVVNHAYAQAWCEFYGQYPPARLSFLTFSLALGHLAVSVFIVISGFCLTLPVVRAGGALRGGSFVFFKRRARRILPPYYAALALSLLLIATVIGEETGTLWDICVRIRGIDVASHALMLQHFFGTGRINYAFWSISLEWQIYFLFPLLVLAFRRSALGTVLLALAVGYALTLHGGGRLARANLHYLGLFTLGMLAARLSASAEPWFAAARRRAPFGALAATLLVAASALMIHWGWRASIEHWPALDLLVGLGAAALLVSAARSPGSALTRAFAARPLTAVGRSSYSLYLIHAPLLQLVWLYGARPLRLTGVGAFVALMAVGVPLILGVTHLFHRAFEAPFVRPPSRAREPAVAV